MKDTFFKILAGPVGKIVGHRNLIRAGKYIERAGRLDFPNSISKNGESLVQEVVLRNCPAPVIVDCGANKGQWSTEMASNAGKISVEGGRAYCLEPSSYTFAELEKNLSKIPPAGMAFTPVNIALSNACGKATLQIVHDGAGTNSLILTPTARGATETVEMKTLDVFAAD
ncbi:MAG: FkbM family methyltransferase, partial [Thermodesulfobacteriota bacterium]|nr:FkbM family methyltransferase [Thermodesulfobacteriota bacterium]